MSTSAIGSHPEARPRGKRFRGQPWLYGVIAILLGVVAITGSRLLGLLDFVGKHTAMEVLRDVGIALFIFGLFNAMLELPEWKKYFGERIKEIVIQQDYLDGLDPRVLSEIETNVLKALLRSPSLDEKGSLHHFVRKHIQGLLPLPYLENAHAEVVYEYDEPGTLLVTDIVSYNCRAVDGRIARDIRWQGGEDSFLEVQAIEFAAIYPGGRTPQNPPPNPLASAKPGERKLTYELKEEHAVDGMRIVMLARYRIEETRMQYWELTRPAKGVEVTLKFPDWYRAEFSAFLPARGVPPTVGPGYYHFRYDDWTLKNCGFAWQLREPAGSP